jgi:MerR family redox-sensitive transcriptional activator SoxR
MRIGELARAVGLRTSAIRYYENIGVLRPASRVSRQREYGSDAVTMLRVVQAAQEAGFTLAEVRTLLSISPSDKGAPTRWQEIARAKLRELDERIARMISAKEALLAALDSACPGIAAECNLVTGRRTPARPSSPSLARRRSRSRG